MKKANVKASKASGEKKTKAPRGLKVRTAVKAGLTVWTPWNSPDIS